MSSREHYGITANDIPSLVRELNFAFARIADRMDKIEGVRGTSTIESNLDLQSNKIVDVSEGTDNTDGATKGQLIGTGPTFDTLTVTNNVTVGGDLTSTGDIKVEDENETLIHSFEVGS